MTDILYPVIEVRIGSDRITVRELAWREALAFLQQLAAAITATLGTDGTFTLTPQSVQTIVAGSAELTEALLCKSCDRDAAWLARQRTTDILALLDAAIELNLSPEIIDRGKKIAGRVQAAFGPVPAPVNGIPARPAASSTSSSAKVTASRT